MGKIDIKLKQCTTPEFRVSFPNVFEKKSYQGQEAKYSITMLFAKTADLKELKRAAANAAMEKWGAKEKWPKGLRLPFRDGDEKSDLMGYSGTTFVSASSKKLKPQVVSAKRDPETNKFRPLTDEEFYAGCYARATLIAFAYDTAGNRGISFSLQNIQKIRDGQQFSGRKDADQEFEELDDGSDDVSNYRESDSEESSLGF